MSESNSGAQEALPLMAVDNERAEAERGRKGDVAIDMTNKPKQATTQFPRDFDIDQFLSLEPKIGSSKRRAAFVRLIEDARRNADIDCASTQLTPEDMEITERAEEINSLIKESKNECLTIVQWSAILDLRKLLPRLLQIGSDSLQLTPNTKKSVAVIATEFLNDQFTIELIKNCRNKRELISQETSVSKSLLEISCYQQCNELVTFLLDNFREYYLEDSQGIAQTLLALSTAVKEGFVEVVRNLINKGVPLNDSDTSGIPPLVLAVQLERLEVAKFLLSIPSCEVDIEASTKDTSLMVAARSEQSKALKILLKESQPDINKITSTLLHGPKTALSEAAKLGRTDNVSLLLKKGAKVVNVQGKTCNSLTCAALARQADTGELLINPFVEEILVKNTKVTKTQFEDTLMKITANNQSSVLAKLLHHDKFDECLELFGGGVILWECLMRASEKGLKSSVLVLLKCNLTPKVTMTRKNNELVDLAERVDKGDTPLHRLASTCLDSEIIENIGAGNSKEGVNPNWLLIQTLYGKTVLEHISKESVLFEFLGLNSKPSDAGEKDGNPCNVKWVETMPRNHSDVFSQKHIAIDRELIILCFKRFPKVAETILNSMVAAKGWGIHDDSLEILINWENINNVKISSECCNCENQNYSELLSVTADHHPELLSNPVLKLLQREHWHKLPVWFFRWQVVWAFILAIMTTCLILSWKSGEAKAGLATILIVVGVLSLLVNCVQLTANWKHYATCYYNWVQMVIYVFVVIMSFTASAAFAKDDIKANFNERYCWFSLLLLATWLNLFAVLQRSTLIGLYVIMFKSALVSFISISIPLSLLLYSFGITFYALYSDTSDTMDNNDFQSFIMKVSSMAIGSVESTEMGSDSASGFYNPRLILALAFVIMVTVITFNLLTGLVIKDVNEALENSKLIFMKLRIKQISQSVAIANLVGKCIPSLHGKLVFKERMSYIKPNKEQQSFVDYLKSTLDSKSNSFMSEKVIHAEIVNMCKKD